MPKKIPKKEKEGKKETIEKLPGKHSGGLPPSALVGVGPGIGIGRDSYIRWLWHGDYLQYQAYGMVILICEKWKKKGLQGYMTPDREGTQIGRHGIILVI